MPRYVFCFALICDLNSIVNVDSFTSIFLMLCSLFLLHQKYYSEVFGIPFETVPQFLDVLFVFIHFLFAFQCLLSSPQVHGFFTWHISPLMSPLKACFIFVTMFLILAFLLNSSLEFPSLYLHKPPVFECCLFFPLKLLTY